MIIRYSNGKMEVNLVNFFPTTIEKVKKLKKVIALDHEHEECLKQEIIAKLESRIKVMEESLANKSELEKLKKNLREMKR